MLAAEWEVNSEADKQPDEESYPGLQRQSHHQYQAKGDRNHRQPRRTGHTESALTVGLRLAQHDHAERHDDKGEQRPDIRQVSKGPISDARRFYNQPRDQVLNAESRGPDEPCEHLGKQSIAQPHEPDGACQLKHQQGAQHADNCADAHPLADPVYPSTLAHCHQRRIIQRVIPGDPVSTSETEMYSSAQTWRLMIPNGRSRCGRRHSSAAVETESNPI